MRIEKVILDSNVLISAIVFDGIPRKILQIAIRGRINISISDAILEEVRGVLTGSKFRFHPKIVHSIISELNQLCELVSPSRNIHAVKDDPDDNLILECAVESLADIVISGDKHLLRLAMFEGIPILSPSQFIREFEK